MENQEQPKHYLLNQPVYYADYLQLDKLLSSQKRQSELLGKPAHDEMLFITVHQVYELWFKQALFELDSVIAIFQSPYIQEKEIAVAASRLERLIEIQKLMIAQIQLIETMQPQDFLEFRDYLHPASGFQSFQFRQLENRLGLLPSQRLKYNQADYHQSLSAEHQAEVEKSEASPPLFQVVENWLIRTPFLNFEGFDFWAHYRQAVEEIFERDFALLQQNLSDTDLSRQIKRLEKAKADFSALFSETAYQTQVQAGQRRLDYQATKAALLIILYRDEPILSRPYRILMHLMSVDENFTNWRYRHAQMVQRMIGTKIGTGGSMGFSYLMETLEKHRIFSDFNHLTTFLVSRSALPELPSQLKEQLGFAYRGQKDA